MIPDRQVAVLLVTHFGHQLTTSHLTWPPLDHRGFVTGPGHIVSRPLPALSFLALHRHFDLDQVTGLVPYRCLIRGRGPSSPLHRSSPPAPVVGSKTAIDHQVAATSFIIN